MSNIQTGAERMPHDLSHLGFLAGQIGRLITISTTPDRKSGSAGMPRPISYAVFCLKKKNDTETVCRQQRIHETEDAMRPAARSGAVRKLDATGGVCRARAN